jgi:hypothetical protein
MDQNEKICNTLAQSAHDKVRPDPLIGLEHDVCEREMAFPTFRTWQVARVAWSHCGWFMYVLTNRMDKQMGASGGRSTLLPLSALPLVYIICALKLICLLGIPADTR